MPFDPYQASKPFQIGVQGASSGVPVEPFVDGSMGLVGNILASGQCLQLAPNRPTDLAAKWSVVPLTADVQVRIQRATSHPVNKLPLNSRIAPIIKFVAKYMAVPEMMNSLIHNP